MRTVNGDIEIDDQDLSGFVRAVGEHFDTPVWKAKVTVNAETADTRRVRVQVADRLGRDEPGLFVLLVSFQALSGGPPGGTQTVSVVTGTSMSSLTSNALYLVRTNAGGLAELDLTVSGAGTRHVGVLVMGRQNPATAVVFA